MIGPPTVPPYMFQRTFCFGRGAHAFVTGPRGSYSTSYSHSELVVAEEFPNIAVEAFVPDLMVALTMPPSKLPNSAGSVIGDQVEFLDRIRRRRVAEQVVRYLIVVHAVEQEIVGLLAIAVDQRTPTVTAGVVAVIEAARIGRNRARAPAGSTARSCATQAEDCRSSPH